jgi:signal peptidase I
MRALRVSGPAGVIEGHTQWDFSKVKGIFCSMTFTAVLRNLAAAAIFSLGVAAQAAVAERPLTGESLDTVLADAHRIASRRADLQVVRIEGRSMLPYFGEGSVVIVKKIEAAQLRTGMVVVYQNRFGETVAHRLVASATHGSWIAQGYNNVQADSTKVNDSNLVGVVYVTLHSNGQVNDTTAIAGLMSNTSVALAAPAK